jgi:hypothetical protein
VRAVNDKTGLELVDQFNLSGYHNVNLQDVSTIYAAVTKLMVVMVEKDNGGEASDKKTQKKKGWFRW